MKPRRGSNIAHPAPRGRACISAGLRARPGCNLAARAGGVRSLARTLVSAAGSEWLGGQAGVAFAPKCGMQRAGRLANALAPALRSLLTVRERDELVTAKRDGSQRRTTTLLFRAQATRESRHGHRPRAVVFSTLRVRRDVCQRRSRPWLPGDCMAGRQVLRQLLEDRHADVLALDGLRAFGVLN